jgi:adenylate kinase
VPRTALAVILILARTSFRFEIVKFCKILLEEKVNSKKSEEADEIQKLKEELEALKKQKNNETIE